MFQWLTNGSGRPAGPLGGSVVWLRISAATFWDDGLGFAVSAATGIAPRLEPIATAKQNKPPRTKTHFDRRRFRFDMKKLFSTPFWCGANLVFIAVRPLYSFLSSY